MLIVKLISLVFIYDDDNDDLDHFILKFYANNAFYINI